MDGQFRDVLTINAVRNVLQLGVLFWILRRIVRYKGTSSRLGTTR